MQRTHLDSLFTATRILLLATSLVAVAVGCIWGYRRAWVAGFDRDVVVDYKRQYTKRFRQALAVGEESPEQARELMTALADDLDPTRKGDRLGPLKVRTLGALQAAAAARGEREQALDWNGRILDFDDHNLLAERQRCGILSQLPGRGAEALAGLEELYRRIPGVPWAVQAYSRALVKAGRLEEAVDTATRYEDSVRSKSWRVLTIGGKDKIRGGWLMPRRYPGDLLELEWEHTPCDHTRLRISFPSFSNAVFEELEIEFRAKETVRVALTADMVKVSSASFVGEKIVAGGKQEAYIEFPIPSVKGARRGMTCVLRVRVREYPAGPLRSLCTGATYKTLLLGLADDEARLQRLRRARGMMLPQQSWFVLWRAEGGDYGVERKRVAFLGGSLDGELVRFQSELEIGADAVEVRINPPAVQGTVFDVERLEAEIDGERVDLLSLAVLHEHSVLREGRRIEIDGRDPYIVFALDRAAHVGRIFFEGTAR